MKSAVEGASGVYLSPGGDMALRLYAAAAELSSLWAQVDWLRKQSFPQTATGEELDKHARLRALERLSGKPATGFIRFEADGARENEVSVPKGTVCRTAAGLEFETSVEGLIAAGESFTLVPAAARLKGTAGNVPAGAIYQMTLAPTGVSRCSNPQAFSGGTDEESDEELRGRVLASFLRLPNGSNCAYYEAEALNTEGVGAVKVLPKRRGIGTVDLIVASDAGQPEPEVISRLQEKFEAEREICVDVLVAAPVNVPVDVSVAVKCAEGFQTAKVVSEVKAALEAMFSGQLLGRTLYRAKIGNTVYSIPGVENYTLTEPSQDVPIEGGELPSAGTITVTGS